MMSDIEAKDEDEEDDNNDDDEIEAIEAEFEEDDDHLPGDGVLGPLPGGSANGDNDDERKMIFTTHLQR